MHGMYVEIMYLAHFSKASHKETVLC